ncbi:MAG: peptidyl-prolyl cis-trans isomerase B (cyclophilin B) [Gammaproteobacteria bacterium]|jgi:peptidyl-prolyl cis-trans isomerase B (cyclophilin B)|tara:strand:- start:336 stop:935 length:600 start_codon:yes stop_codon:yes gene_type:complete
MIRNTYLSTVALICITISSCYGDSIHKINHGEETKLIKLTTTKGNIVIKLFSDKAPETVKNFLNYTENGNYNGTIFHRVIQNFMVQGGGLMPDMSEFVSNAPVVNESNNDLSNKKGTVAMARTSDPHSATSQFFINLKDNDFLDKKNAPDGYGYCVFGEVVEGMDIVENIGTVSTGNTGGHGDVPQEPIVVEKVEVIEE